MRDAQFIPLGWRHLTAVDVDHIRARVDATLGDPAATLLQLETCLLLWASLVTGRVADELVPLSLRRVPRNERTDDQPVGLLKVEERWGWWLNAAAPAEQRPAPPGWSCMRPWTAFVYLPATKRVVILINRCLRLRRDAAGGSLGARAPVPLFQHGAALIDGVTELLTTRNTATAGSRARRATTTPEAVARWLPSALTHAVGGDAVPASIICGHVERAAETAIYYGSVRLSDLVLRYEHAIAAIDELIASPKFIPVFNAYAGDRLTPTDDAVRAAAEKLGTDLTAPGLTLAERHLALTRYTVALLSFALAHRVKFGSFPATGAVDAETGFVWIADKKLRGKQPARLVWICDIAWKQLQIYDRHLADLEHLAGSIGPKVAEQRRSKDLALFRLTKGSVEPVRVYDAVNEAMSHAGLPLANAGRHWLRAALLGRCSSDTINAFYGHGLIEDGVWDWAGGLDPCAYRADLARTLDPVLASVGWVPRVACAT